MNPLDAPVAIAAKLAEYEAKKLQASEPSPETTDAGLISKVGTAACKWVVSSCTCGLCAGGLSWCASTSHSVLIHVEIDPSAGHVMLLVSYADYG